MSLSLLIVLAILQYFSAARVLMVKTEGALVGMANSARAYEGKPVT